MGPAGACTAAVAAAVRPAATALATGGPAVFVATQCWGSGPAPAMDGASAELHELALNRDEARTYLALPARLVVYSADERAEFLARRPPSGYPFFGSIRQYWAGYNAACEVTSREHVFAVGDHVALAAAGAAFSVEYALTGLWENTVGHVTEWLSSASKSWPEAAPTPEDAFAIAHGARVRRVHPQDPLV